MYHFHFEPEIDHSGKAKTAIDRAMEINPDLPEAHLALGSYYYWCLKDYDRALNQFGFARKKLPNDTRALEGIAYIQRRQGNCEAALAGLQKALLLSPRDLRITNETANTLSMMRRYSEADQYYVKAIQLSPNQIFPYLYRIENSYLWEGTIERAEKIFQDLPASERNIDAYRITHKFYAKDFPALISLIESSPVDLFDNQNGFVTKEQLLGRAYRLSNDPERSKYYFEKARLILESHLKSKPDDPRILCSLGMVYAGLGNTEEAIQLGIRGVKAVPIDKNVVEGIFRGMELAKIYVMSGRYDEALERLELLLGRQGYISVRLLQLDPDFEPLLQHPRFQRLVERYHPT
jgi:tetratricopeptide (TPR) repeat protein